MGRLSPRDLSSSTPPAADPNAPAPSDRLWLRSELMGTQVITRDTGRRLGVVGEVVVDIDRREVVALGLRDNPLTRFLPGLPRWMPLERIRQVGDVILVDSADSLAEGFDPERYSKVINCQVVTESGVQLGRVLGFSFDVETGELTTLVIGALGVPLLGEGVLSTWEMPVGEIVSSGSDRIIVYEGAEEKLKQLGTGLLEKLGIGGSSWEQEERERFRAGAVPAENQLPAGQASATEQRRIQPATSRSFRPDEEFDYVELEERREREPLRQRRYLDDEEPQAGRPRRFEEEDPIAPEPEHRDGYGDRGAYGERQAYGAGQAYGARDAGPGRDALAGSYARREPYGDRLSEGDRRSIAGRGDDTDLDAYGSEAPPQRPGRSWEPARREADPERNGSRGPAAERSAPVEAKASEDAEAPRRPLPLEARPAPRRRPEPVDVEPEVLDDPW